MNDVNPKGVRLATLDDVPALQAIYAYYVEQTVVSFEYVAPNVVEFQRRLSTFSRSCPYLVYEEKGSILGYAYAHPAFERAAYAWCAETTIYVAKESRSCGIGRALYGALIELLEIQGYRNLYAVVVAENQESCQFHLKNGYRLIGGFPKSGFKFGRWLDVAWYERSLGENNNEPQRPILFSELPDELIQATCAKYC